MKYALVTGGSRGIGRAICARLAAEGYNLLINYRSNEAAAQEALTEVTEKGVQAELLQFDVADKEATNKALETWLENNKGKQIEILVNNAGIRNDALFAWMEDDQWNGVLDTNLKGWYYTTKIVFKHMLLQRYGRIVNVVSLSGLKGMKGQTNYAASKAAVIAATKSLAQEVGRAKITVNAVAPGFIKTDMTEDLDEKQLKQMIPLRRFGKAEEVADLVAFLASPKAGYITGEVVSINGGLYT